MARSLWQVFRSLFDRTNEDDEEETDDNRFVPSPMDLSVRVSHGGSDADIQRELDDISQQAAELEETDRHQK